MTSPTSSLRARLRLCVVLGVAALVNKVELSLLGADDGYELIVFVVLTEVRAQSALSVRNCLHGTSIRNR